MIDVETTLPFKARPYGQPSDDLRWLVNDVLPQSARLYDALPTPSMVSSHIKNGSKPVSDYTLWWITHPDPMSRFASRTSWLRCLPKCILLRTILLLGYDGLVYRRDESIIGHVFFQRRRDSIFAFSVAVNRSIENRGFSAVMGLDFLAFGFQTPGVCRMRIGRGENNVTRRLLERLKKREDLLGWRVHQNGWVLFPNKTS